MLWEFKVQQPENGTILDYFEFIQANSLGLSLVLLRNSSKSRHHSTANHQSSTQPNAAGGGWCTRRHHPRPARPVNLSASPFPGLGSRYLSRIYPIISLWALTRDLPILFPSPFAPHTPRSPSVVDLYVPILILARKVEDSRRMDLSYLGFGGLGSTVLVIVVWMLLACWLNKQILGEKNYNHLCRSFI